MQPSSPPPGAAPERIDRRRWPWRLALLAGLLLQPWVAGAGEPRGLSPAARLGQQIFLDPSLSASGRLACATCHDPGHAFGPPDAASVQCGGAAMDRPGLRAVPSLRYVLDRTPAWSQPYVASPAERLIEGTEPPVGGFGWDGRFASLREQAASALLAADEMANAGPADLLQKLRRAPYAAQFRRVFGAGSLRLAATAFDDLLRALERFELEAPALRPFSSRFDDYLDGRVALSPQEQRGQALFDDPRGGNCATCHPDRKGADGSHPLFTDYQFEALGVPRNRQLAANQDQHWFDEGLCGPLRSDQPRSDYCGLFKTPTLRNVATRATFFHNGRFHDLKEALRFYVRRDTDPRLWYPQSGSTVEKFDDLPAALRGNVDVIDEPLTRHAGDRPAWSDADIDAVAAFLQTLTDRDAQSAAAAPGLRSPRPPAGTCTRASAARSVAG